MDFNGGKLGDILELIRGYKSHRLTLIDGHKANDGSVELLIMEIINRDLNYTYCSDGTILEITRK